MAKAVYKLMFRTTKVSYPKTYETTVMTLYSKMSYTVMQIRASLPFRKSVTFVFKP